MKITKHAQSAFLIETKGRKILVDPGSFVFNEEGVEPEVFGDVDLILITHEHSDHFDKENIQRIIALAEPIVIGTKSVIDALKQDNPDIDLRVSILGENHQFEGFDVEVLASQHGPLPNGNPAPEVTGYVIDDGEKRFYTPGDSIYLNKEARADIIAVPICGQVVLNINEAKVNLLEAKPELAIPIHYDNSKYPVDVNDFAAAMVDSGIEVKVLKNGEEIEL